MAKKKTTLMIEESIYDQARIRAAERRESVSDFVAEAVRQYLASGKKKAWIELPVSSVVGEWIPKHVNPNSNAEIQAYLDEVEGVRELRW